MKIKIPILFACLLVFSGICFTTAYSQVKKKTITKHTKKTYKKIPVKVVVKKAPGTRIRITTDSGIIIVRLYDKTPRHRDNFIKLVNNHFYDSLLFHRVIMGFMIQGGDPESKTAVAGAMLGNGDVGYTIPAEFDITLFHKRGALAAARTNNPEKASSGCQFYIVQGRLFTDAELNEKELQMGKKYTDVQRIIYKTVGGTAQLDMDYTVFGETESGLEVIDKIAGVPRDANDRPLGDLHMKMEIVK